MEKIILASIIYLVSNKSNAQELLVSNIAEYNKAIKSAKAGSTIILKNGISCYKRCF